MCRSGQLQYSANVGCFSSARHADAPIICRTLFDGSITLDFGAVTELDLEAYSRFGQVRVEGAIEQRERAGNYFRGRLGDGKTMVRLTTSNGNIDVELKD